MTSSAVPLCGRAAVRPDPAQLVDVESLLTAWRAGDDTARDLVLGEVRRRTVRYLAGLRVPPHEREDLAQEVCLGVLSAAPSWQAKGTSLWALVFAIARNKHVDRLRRTSRAPVLGHAAESVAEALGTRADAETGPEEHVLHGESARRTAALLAQLPATQRDVVVLRVVVGLTVAETAHALGLGHGSVHVIQHRGLTRLRALLAGCERSGVEQPSG